MDVDLIRPQTGQRHRKTYGETMRRGSQSRSVYHGHDNEVVDRDGKTEEDYTAKRRTAYRRAQVSRQALTKRLSLVVAFSLIVLVIVAGGWYMYSSSQSNAAAGLFDKQKYQAVFLAGGQVYFGKLQLVDNQYLKLTNVFYIQSDSSASKTTGASASADKDGNMQLIKLGDEVHGPDDSMTINRDQVLFFEDLKSDGKVAQLIEKYQQGN